jgi:tetratricopeptide (TPR) repeat protein
MCTHGFFIAALLAARLVTAPEAQPVQTARALFSTGNYDEAIKTLLTAHYASPGDAAINYWLERSYYEKQNYEQAIVYGEQAVTIDSQNAEYHQWLGRAYGGKAEQSHSFFLARKVKKTFETAVDLAPRNVAARRDLIQYLIEAPWIVGGDKEKAKQQIDVVATLDPIQGRLARAGFLVSEKRWKQAELEYLAAVDQQPSQAEPYMEAAEFFAGRRDAENLEGVIGQAARIGIHDPRIDFYRAVVLVLRRADLPAAEALLGSYLDKAPERSDYPSHNAALRWLRIARNNANGKELSRK